MKSIKMVGVFGLLVASFSLVGFSVSTDQSKISESNLETLNPTTFTAGRSQKTRTCPSDCAPK